MSTTTPTTTIYATLLANRNKAVAVLNARAAKSTSPPQRTEEQGAGRNGSNGISTAGGDMNRKTITSSESALTPGTSTSSSAPTPFTPRPPAKVVHRGPVFKHADGTMEFNCASDVQLMMRILQILKESGMVRLMIVIYATSCVRYMYIYIHLFHLPVERTRGQARHERKQRLLLRVG
jgi:hypothetical protein